MASKKHAELIRAWLDGAVIELNVKAKGEKPTWAVDGYPTWDEHYEYRVQPLYPETAMSDKELFRAAGAGDDVLKFRAIANEAIRHAIDNGQVIVPLNDEHIASIVAEQRAARDIAIAEAVRSACLEQGHKHVTGFDAARMMVDIFKIDLNLIITKVPA
jgi:hypothetical protein